MSGRNFSWNKENYKRFGKVLKSSLKWAQAEVSSLSGSVFMFIRMRLVNFFQWRIFHIVFLQTGSHFYLNLPCLFFPLIQSLFIFKKCCQKASIWVVTEVFGFFHSKIMLQCFKCMKSGSGKNGFFKADSEGSHWF